MTRSPNPPPPQRGGVGPRRPPVVPAPGTPPQPATPPQPSAPAATYAGPDIIAKPARYYRNTRFIMVAVLLACAGWFGLDGLRTYPNENHRFEDLQSQINKLTDALDIARSAHDMIKANQLQQQIGDANVELAKYKLHSPLDIRAQIFLAFVLPFAAAFTLWWALHNSRGVYRLAGDTLHVPGHPPVKLATITKIDKSKWGRKGIAWIDYRTDRDEGRIRLDDFVYDRDPTDAIYKKIDDHMNTRSA